MSNHSFHSYLAHRVYKIARQLERYYNERFVSIGMTAQQFMVLSFLTNFPNSPANKIAETLGIDKATVTNLLNQLEKRDLVKRTVNPLNRRSIQVYLTKRGEQVTERLVHLADEFEALIEQTITHEERTTFELVLDRISKMIL